MEICFITTVYNEEDTIVTFLNSLSTQTKLPDRILIVDGGSMDSTLELIQNSILRSGSGQEFKIRNKKVKLRLIIKNGNRSVGRNEAIRLSNADIIVASDAGCVFDKNWLKEITKPFENEKIDVVAGFYRPVVKNVFQKCLACYTCVMPDKVDKNNFLPSSRSIAFRKKVWEKVGGYPEDLDTCEDLVFAKKLKDEGFKFKFAGNAIVYWEQKKNLFEAFNQFFSYAKGDGQAFYVRAGTPFLFFRYFLGFVLFVYFMQNPSLRFSLIIFAIFMLYFFWSIFKNFRYVKNIRAIYILPALQITADIAVIVGFLSGIIKRWGIRWML